MIRRVYSYVYDNLDVLRKGYIVVAILYAVYQVIYSFLHYTVDYLLLQLLTFLFWSMIGYAVLRLFHALFGKWYIHENNVELTRIYLHEKLPRSVKFDGYRGAGKDTTVSGIVKTLRNSLIDNILEEMDLIRVVLYPYDVDALENYLEDHHREFMTNSKNQFFQRFILMIKETNAFIKPFYQKDFDVEAHLQELYFMKKDPNSDQVVNIKYKYDDGISKKHFLTVLIRYSLLYIRINHLENFIVTNQPYMETKAIPAKIFSTNFINIQKDDAQWVWPIVGGVIIIETEADAFYPNVAAKGSAMKTGMRNFKAFFRHLLGEESVWIHIGQKAARTEKAIRELDQAFITVLDRTKVEGGEKRIFFYHAWLRWVEYWIQHSLRRSSKEKQLRRRSIAHQKIKQAENEGYLYMDLKVSRTDDGTKAEQMTIRQLLRYDKPIFENYSVKLCFPIKDCYGWFNSHYLEAIAETLASKTKIQFQDVPAWNPDLIMTKKHAAFMNYPVLNEMLDIKPPPKGKQKQNPKSDKEEGDEFEGAIQAKQTGDPEDPGDTSTHDLKPGLYPAAEDDPVSAAEHVGTDNRNDGSDQPGSDPDGDVTEDPTVECDDPDLSD
jgi:hypothetical protein